MRSRLRRLACAGLVVLAAALVPAAPARAQPANDAFAAAEVVPAQLPAGVRGTTVDATHEEGEPSHAGAGELESVWYRWTPAVTATVVIDVCDADFDSVLAVYTGDAVTSLTGVASNDDACGPDGSGSRVRIAARAGTTYSIAVATFDEVGGDFTLRLALPPPPPQPEPGRYTGRADFGERISFVLNRRRNRISRLTIRNVDLTCRRGQATIIRFVFRKRIRVRRGRFVAAARVRGRNRFRQYVRVSGRLVAPRRAQGNLTVRVSDRFVGSCRHFAGRIDWTALRR